MLNPVFRRELRTVLRSWKTYGTVMAYVLILAIVAGIAVWSMTGYNSYYGYNYGFDPQNSSTLYAVLSCFQFILIMIITPALTAGAIAGERERQTLNLMLITKMTPFRITVGKLLSSLSVTLLMIVAAMPVFAIVFYFGGVSLIDLLAMTMYTILSSAAVGSICIFMSSVFKRTVSATVSSYIVVIALCVGTFILAAIGVLALSMMQYSSGFGDIYEYLSNLDSQARVNILLLGYALVFSVNPFVGFLAIIDTQLGTDVINDMFYRISYYGGYYNIQQYNLWMFNVAACIIIIVAMLFFTSKVLKPVKESRRRK